MYVTFALVNEENLPLHYTLKNGETLLETLPPTGLKPQWTGKDWKELATPEEIKAEEKARYESMGWQWPPTGNIAEIQAQAIDELIIMVFDLQAEIDELKSQ